MTGVLDGRLRVAFRCRHCPSSRVLYRTSDALGRRIEVRRAALALASVAAPDHVALFGHELELIEVAGGLELAVKINA